jgi:YD repeat-containing protein
MTYSYDAESRLTAASDARRDAATHHDGKQT